MKKKLKHRRKTPDYKIRAAALAKLGFRTYRDYLASPLWRSIRGKVFQRGRRRCAFCGERASQVHHYSYTYRVLRGQKLSHLALCCGSCHKDIEFWPDGSKRDPSEVRARARELKRAYQRQRAVERADLDALVQVRAAMMRDPVSTPALL